MYTLIPLVDCIFAHLAIKLEHNVVRAASQSVSFISEKFEPFPCQGIVPAVKYLENPTQTHGNYEAQNKQVQT